MSGLTSEIAGYPTNTPGAGGLFDLWDPPRMVKVTALQDRPGIDLETAKTRLGIDVDTYDTTLGLLVTMALQIGDANLHNWFTEDDTETGTEEDIPEAVTVGLLAFIAAQWMAMEPANASLFSTVVAMGRVSDSSISRERKGDVEIEYRGDSSGGPGGRGRTESGQLAGLVAAWPYWQIYAMAPGL